MKRKRSIVNAAIVEDISRTDEWNEWRTGTVVEIETIHQIVSRLCDEITVLQAEIAELRAELTRLRVINTLREVER
jgi:hypothetical protein